ncbi:unnamed protein product [Paramecium sonneborni]|uniref:Transmembrane protein n=1 Tax=Paramecium sonneborni TaxID=65129 RepID=A0A8S1REP4_9CILI|nr:unnamed protein product [Paramecium sonneborni]
MFILLSLSVVLGCVVKNTELTYLYPTENEVYKLYMNEIFDGEDLFYLCFMQNQDDGFEFKDQNLKRCNFNDDGLEVENVLTEIQSKTTIDEFKLHLQSISAYQNYFSLIQTQSSTNKTPNYLVAYQVDYTQKTLKQLMNLSIEIYNDTCLSYSSVYVDQDSIIIDCYQNNEFYFLLIENNSTINIYQQRTTVQNIQNSKLIYRNNYIIYAVFFQNNSSVLSNYYYNQTTKNASWLSEFTNSSIFTDISLMANENDNEIAILNLTNCLFISSIMNLNELKQINFPVKDNQNYNNYYLALKPFPSYKYGQLLTSFYVVNNNFYENIYELQFNGTNLTYIHIFDSPNQYELNFNLPITICFSSNFLVVYQNYFQTFFYIGKYSNNHEYQSISQIYSNKIYDDSLQLLLNYEQNILIEFSYRLKWYLLKEPKLKIDITNQNKIGQIKILAYQNPEVHEYFELVHCNHTLYYEQISQYNYSILNSTNQTKLKAVQNFKQVYRLNNHYTGPLMQLSFEQNSTNSSISISNPQNEVFQYIKNNLPSLQVNQSQLYFIQDFELLFYAWTSTKFENYVFYTICSFFTLEVKCLNEMNISCDSNLLTNIQLSQLNQTEILLVFDQGNQNIQVYSIQFEFQKLDQGNILINLNQSVSNYNFTTSNSLINITQFLILYNKLIVLNNQNEIIVQLLSSNTTQYASYVINQSTIDQCISNYSGIQFTPIQIAINQLSFQSNLLINNNDSIIILGLFTQSYLNQNFTVLSYKQVGYKIYQIFALQMYIIITNITNITNNMINFIVYEISDISNPTFYKPLPNCTIYPGWQIISDNYFFYVKQINSNILVYDLGLPFHSALYYNLSLNEQYNISCTSTNEFSILSFKNNLYASFQNNPYSFNIFQKDQQQGMWNYTLLQINIYNYLNNNLNQLNQNFQLIVINIYLQISMNQTQFNKINGLALTLYSNDLIFIPLNMTDVTMGQVVNYSILAVSNTNNQTYITNQFQNKSQYFNNQIVNATQIASFCDSLLYQNISGLFQSSYVIFDGLLLNNYSNLTFTECQSLSVSVNGFGVNINSICKLNNIYTVISYFPATNDLINKTSQICNNSQPLNFSNNIYQIENANFSSIIKSSQLSHYLFILGQLGLNEKTRSLYIYSLNYLNQNQTINKPTHKIKCRGGISDYNYTILQNKSLINSTYSGRGVIFYLCQYPSQLKYVNFNITNTTNLTFARSSNRISDLVTSYVQESNSNFLQIFIYLVKFDQIILVLTSEDTYNLVIILSYSPLSYSENSLQFEDVIAYIPPYGAYNQIPIGVLQNSYLALLFQLITQEGFQNLIAIYNISKIRQTYNLSNYLSYNSTIQMEAGYIFNNEDNYIQQIALINQSDNNNFNDNFNKGQFVMILSSRTKLLINTTLTTLVFDENIYFNCTNLNQCNENKYYYLVASNSFYNYTIPITITFKPLSNLFVAGAFLILTIIICVSLVTWFWKKIKVPNLEEKKEQEDYLEIEM